MKAILGILGLVSAGYFAMWCVGLVGAWLYGF